MQCTFLALVEALETCDPDAGAFLTLYALKLKAAFTEATGQRTKRDQLDPLEHALSLDVPLTDGEGEPFALADVVEDPAAVVAFADVEERDRQARLHKALRTALQALPEAQRAAVVGFFVRGQRTDTKARSAGLRVLRSPAVSRSLRVFL